MALGRGPVIASVASGGDLRPVSATSVFDCRIERGRLALLRGGGELCAVAA